MAVVVHLPGTLSRCFLLAVVGRWLQRKGCVARDVCDGFKEWFPAAHHSSPPVKVPGLSSSFYRLCLHRDFGRIFFGKRTSATCRCPRRTIVLPRQITHLSDRVKTKDRVTGVHRAKKKKNSVFSGSLNLVRTSQPSGISRKSPYPKFGYLPSPEEARRHSYGVVSPHRVLNFPREIAPNFFSCSR